MPVSSLDLLRDPARLAALQAAGLLDEAPEAAFDRLTRLAATLLDVPVALISLVDDRRQFFTSAVGLAEPWASQRGTPLSHSFCQHVVADDAPLLVEDARVHPKVRDNLAIPDLGVIAYAGVPIRTTDNHVLGAFCAIGTTPRPWSDDEVALLAELAASFVREIELRGLTRECLRKELVLRAVLDQMGDSVIVAAPEGNAALVNVEMRKQLGSFADAPPGSWPAPYGIFLADKVTPCPPTEVPLGLALAGARVEPRELWVWLPGMAEPRWHSVNAAPILDETGSLVGAVTVGRDVTEQKRSEARMAAHADELSAMAIRDELTGLVNRRGFMSMATAQLDAAEHARRSAMLVFVDLNGMKGINDRLGHELGDLALRDTAEVLRRTFRSSDVIARLGGDEFVVMVDDVDDERRGVVLDRLHRSLDHQIATHDRPFRLSLAVGAVLTEPGSGETLDALMRRGDAAMYDCKRSRRLRVA